MKSSFNTGRYITNILITLLMLLGSASIAAKSKDTTGFQLPDYQEHTLDNGLRVLLMEHREVPMIDAQLVIKTGAIFDRDQPGLAQATAANLLFGTDTMSKTELEQFLEFRGVSLSSDASLEYSSIVASYLARDNEQVLPTLAAIASRAAFVPAEWQKHQKRRLDQLQRRKESPSRVAYDYFKQLIYPDHPYQTIADGTAAGVANLDIAALKQFYRSHYRPDNAALILVGDFNSGVMLQRIKQIFGVWEAPATPLPKLTIAEPSKPTAARVLLVNKADARQSTFYIGGRGVAFDHPEYIPLAVVNTILGGRFSSWLNGALRVNSGLTYGAGSRFVRSRHGGSFFMSSFTDTKTTEEAIDLALNTYQRLWQQGIDQATLDSAKTYIKGQFPLRYETSSQLADLLAGMVIYGYDQDYVNQFEAKVNGLSKQSLQALIADYFPKENLQFLIIGRADALRDTVKKYGKVIEVDIDQAGFKPKFSD